MSNYPNSVERVNAGSARPSPTPNYVPRRGEPNRPPQRRTPGRPTPQTPRRKPGPAPRPAPKPPSPKPPTPKPPPGMPKPIPQPTPGGIPNMPNRVPQRTPRLPYKIPGPFKFIRGLGWIGVGYTAWELVTWVPPRPLTFPGLTGTGAIEVITYCNAGLVGEHRGALQSIYCGNQGADSYVNGTGLPYVANRFRIHTWDTSTVPALPIRFRSLHEFRWPLTGAAGTAQRTAALRSLGYGPVGQPKPIVLPQPNVPTHPAHSPGLRPIHPSAGGFPSPNPIKNPIHWPTPVSPEAPEHGPNPQPDPQPQPEAQPTPDGLPDPVVDIITDLINVTPRPRPNGQTSGRPNNEPKPQEEVVRRPPRGTKEGKAQMAPWLRWVWRNISPITEGIELIETAYETFPKYWKINLYRQLGRQPNPAEKAAFVYANMDKFDTGKFINAYIKGQLTDMIYAAGGKQIADINRRFNRPVGYEAGGGLTGGGLTPEGMPNTRPDWLPDFVPW